MNNRCYVFIGFLLRLIFSETFEIMSDDMLEFGQPCSITHKFFVLLTEFNIVFSSIGLSDLKSIISQEIFIDFSSEYETSRALTIDGPKPTMVKSLPFFLTNALVGSKKYGLFGTLSSLS